MSADLLTVAEVAADLRVSRMSIYRLVSGRQIESVRVGSSIRIPRPALTAYLRVHTSLPRPLATVRKKAAS